MTDMATLQLYFGSTYLRQGVHYITYYFTWCVVVMVKFFILLLCVCVCVCVCDVHVVTQNGFFCEIIVECWRQEGCATIHQCGHLYRTDWGLYTDTIWYITVTLMCGVYVCTWKSFTTEASEDILIIMHRIVFMCLLFCHCTWLTSNFNGKVQVLQ